MKKAHSDNTGLSVMPKCCAGPAGCPASQAACLPLHQPKPQCTLRTRIVLALAALRPARAAGVLVLAACSSLVSFKSKRKLSAVHGAARFVVPPARSNMRGKASTRIKPSDRRAAALQPPTAAHASGSLAAAPTRRRGWGRRQEHRLLHLHRLLAAHGVVAHVVPEKTRGGGTHCCQLSSVRGSSQRTSGAAARVGCVLGSNSAPAAEPGMWCLASQRFSVRCSGLGALFVGWVHGSCHHHKDRDLATGWLPCSSPLCGCILGALGGGAAAVQGSSVQHALGLEGEEEHCGGAAAGGTQDNRRLSGSLEGHNDKNRAATERHSCRRPGNGPACIRGPLCEGNRSSLLRRPRWAGLNPASPASPLRGLTDRPFMAHSLYPASRVCPGGTGTFGKTAGGWGQQQWGGCEASSSGGRVQCGGSSSGRLGSQHGCAVPIV